MLKKSLSLIRVFAVCVGYEYTSYKDVKTAHQNKDILCNADSQDELRKNITNSRSSIVCLQPYILSPIVCCLSSWLF